MKGNAASAAPRASRDLREKPGDQEQVWCLDSGGGLCGAGGWGVVQRSRAFGVWTVVCKTHGPQAEATDAFSLTCAVLPSASAVCGGVSVVIIFSFWNNLRFTGKLPRWYRKLPYTPRPVSTVSVYTAWARGESAEADPDASITETADAAPMSSVFPAAFSLCSKMQSRHHTAIYLSPVPPLLSPLVSDTLSSFAFHAGPVF